MRFAALFSGGKDSAYALWCALHQGFDIAFLVTVVPEAPDSYMFHYPNVEWTKLQAEALGLPIKLVKVKGGKEGEVESLKERLKGLGGFEGLVSGAIASEYQKRRLDALCEELGLVGYAPLWGKDPEALLREEVEAGFEIIITACMARGLTESWLGRRIDKTSLPELAGLCRKYGVHPTFEGGEAETFVLDCPIFKKRISILEREVRWSGESGYLIIKRAKLVDKALSR
ncbi:TPA: TIGR00289 family protein [Candidatus Bathyarchaeota archaeon]|nr:TIGR00289 family protein [Candidatus Bathyarchaeota archaeon]